MKHAGPIFGMPFSLEGTAFLLKPSPSDFSCTDGTDLINGFIGSADFW
jgi:hypothetical protein